MIAKMKKWVLGFLGLVTVVGCAGDKGGGGGGYKDTGEYFGYAGIYSMSSVTMTFSEGGSTGAPETWEQDLAIEQAGPALKFAGILGLANADGLTFGHTMTSLDWFGQVYTHEYSGASAADDPMSISLTIDGSYADSDYEYTYAYEIVLGEKLDL